MKKLARTLITLVAIGTDPVAGQSTNSTTTTTVLPTSMAEYSVTSIGSISSSAVLVVVAAVLLN